MAKTTDPGERTSIAVGVVRSMVRWRKFRAPVRVPDGTVAAPLAWEGAERVPVVGPLFRMKSITVDPVGLIRRFARSHGDMFTIRTPATPDFTFLAHDNAFRLVLGLPAEHAGIGPVLDGIPTVGFWFPRSRRGTESLQELVLAGRRMMAGLMPVAQVATLKSQVPHVVAQHTEDWHETVDLTDRVYPMVYEAACRYFTGDEIWDSIGGKLTALYRQIVKGIEINHIAASLTAFHYFMPEYHATRALYRLLRRELPRRSEADSPLLRAIRDVRIGGEPLSDADRLWMFMYVLWNATVYPGAYTFWTLVDVVTRPSLVDRLRAMETRAERQEFLGRCLLENIRLNPVSSLIRFLREPLEFEHDGRRYHIPANQMVGVLPGVSNTDPRRIPDAPVEFDPDRYVRDHVSRDGIFGRGPFGCPAPEYNKVLTATILDELLDRFDMQLAAEPPTRVCRVPQIHPNEPTPVHVTRRTPTPAASPAPAVAQCPYSR